MKLIMTLLVSDEVDTLGPNLEYHLGRGVDFAIVTANRAADEILETVGTYVEAGRARLIEEDQETYAQSEWVTRMARLAADEHGADWVINCDADEFYWPETGNLKEALCAVPPAYGILTMPVFHFLPRPVEEGFFADRMTVREVSSGKQAVSFTLPPSRPMFAKVAHRAVPDVTVSRGNHRVTGAGLVALPAWRPIVGLHFPLRTYAQFERKVVKDGRAARNNPEARVARGSSWSELYDAYLAGALPQVYARRVVNDADLESGVREGRLVVDERLKRFFEDQRASEAWASDDRAWEAEVDPGRVEALRVEARRVLNRAWREPLAVESDKLRKRVAALERRAGTLEDRLAESERRRTRAEKERRRAERRADELRAKVELARRTPSTGVGRALALAAGSLRRAAGRVTGRSRRTRERTW